MSKILETSDGLRSFVEDESSAYCIVVPSSIVDDFRSELTDDNLQSFKMITDEGSITYENFTMHKEEIIGDKAYFMLRPLSIIEQWQRNFPLASSENRGGASWDFKTMVQSMVSAWMPKIGSIQI